MRRFVSHVFTLAALALLASPAMATTYYIAPNGNDGASGTNSGNPLDTFDTALAKLSPGDTLVLLNGRYTLGNSGRFFAHGGSGAVDGTASNPITVKAQNERQAHVDGNGRYAFRFNDLEWWVIEGIHVSSADRDNSDVVRGEPFLMVDCNNMVIRRMLADHNNRYENSAGYGINRCQDILIEECEAYYFHRNGFSVFKSDGVTVRRCYANSRGFEDLDADGDGDIDGYKSHKISRDGGDASFVSYYSNNCIIENCISEYKNEGFDTIGGKDAVTGEPSGQNISFYGCISIDDNKAGSFDSRDKGDGIQAITNGLYKDFLIVRPKRACFNSRAVKSATMENVTVINSDNPAFHANFDRQVLRNTIWPSYHAIGNTSLRLRNWLIMNTDKAVDNLPDNDGDLDFQMRFSNLHNTPFGKSENIGDGGGQIRYSTDVNATQMGTTYGEYMAFVPPSSNMNGAGETSGADVGANILYRYENGKMTNERLWNGPGGSFPHGATVGINNNAGESAFDVHERLNVNHDGVDAPYGFDADPGQLVGVGNGIFGEVGKDSSDQSGSSDWHTVNLTESYSNPIAIVQPPSYAGLDASTIRIRNVGSTSFQWQIDEWEYLDGSHGSETVGYLVMKNGPRTLADGTAAQAGKVNITDAWTSVSFGQSFGSAPSVVAQCQTVNGGQAVVCRVRNVTSSGFEVRLQEEEAEGPHTTETVGWVAFQQGTGTADTTFRAGATPNTVNGKTSGGAPIWTTIPYHGDYGNAVFIAGPATYDGPDPISLRYEGLSSGEVDVFVEEEKSADSEQKHTSERVHWMMFNITHQ